MTANIQLSGKLPDGRIFVVGGDTFAEFFTNLSDITPDAQRIVEEATVAISDPPSGQQSQPAAPSGFRNVVPPAPAQSIPGAPSCDHGPRVRRTGTNGKGPWVAWFCPAQKGDPTQCAPKWGDS